MLELNPVEAKEFSFVFFSNQKMAIDANFEDDVAVANCDDVEVGSKKLCLENAAAQVRHGGGKAITIVYLKFLKN